MTDDSPETLFDVAEPPPSDEPGEEILVPGSADHQEADDEEKVLSEASSEVASSEASVDEASSDSAGALDTADREDSEPDADGESSARKKFARALLGPLLLAGGVGAAEYARRRFRRSQTFLPEKYPTGIWEPQGYGLPAEDVWFESHGNQLHGWWIPYKRAQGTVLYCHGNAGNISNRIGVYRFLRRARLNVFTFDYRGYGRSEGEPSESGVFEDAQAAYDFLIDSLGEASERVLIFGHSLGGAVAIDLSLHRPAAGLVAQSTFTSLREMAKVRYPSIPLHLIAGNQFASLDKVPRIEIPKLFIHGTADETVPFEIGRRLYEAATEPKAWYEIAHAGHNDVYRFGGIRYLWRLMRFSRSSLKSARQGVKDGTFWATPEESPS